MRGRKVGKETKEVGGLGGDKEFREVKEFRGG